MPVMLALPERRPSVARDREHLNGKLDDAVIEPGGCCKAPQTTMQAAPLSPGAAEKTKVALWEILIL